MSFFIPDVHTNDLYVQIRDSGEPKAAEARMFLERLWAECSDYLDPDFRRHAADQYETRFWELYLAWTLLQNHVGLRRLPRVRGARPDFQIDAGPWIEAVLATPGSGKNRVPDVIQDGMGQVADEDKILRLRASIQQKAKKWHDYVRSGHVSVDDPYIIAVGARPIPVGMLEGMMPRIVSAVFPFGGAQVRFTVGNLGSARLEYQYRDSIINSNSAPVRTDPFLDASYKHVSGVLYASVDEVNRSDRPGSEYVFVHNPNAAAPLPLGFLSFGTEYWKDGGTLRRRDDSDRDTV